MYKVPFELDIKGAILVSGITNQAAASPHVVGLAMVEIKCFSPEQFVELAESRTVYCRLRRTGNIVLVVEYVYTRDGMLFRYAVRRNNTASVVVKNLDDEGYDAYRIIVKGFEDGYLLFDLDDAKVTKESENYKVLNR